MNPMAPWEDVTFCGVYFNEEKRLPRLLSYVRPWFKNIVVGVQESTDGTEEIARSFSDKVVIDKCHGYAEPTFQMVLDQVDTEWAFVVSGDEFPSLDLLESFQKMIGSAEISGADGVAIKFRSTIEGVDYSSEQDSHIRVFKTRLGWPSTMHSGPAASRPIFWESGHIDHDRSLDEMMRDYLRYQSLAGSNVGWNTHNRLMMHDAVAATAKTFDWDSATDYEWWPDVKREAFGLCLSENSCYFSSGYGCLPEILK